MADSESDETVWSSPGESFSSANHFRKYGLTWRVVACYGICLLLACYVPAFALVRGHFRMTDMFVAKNGNMQFVSTHWYYFSRHDVLNRLCYYGFYPIHRFALDGQTQTEFAADVLARPRAMRRRDVYISDVEAVLRYPGMADLFEH